MKPIGSIVRDGETLATLAADGIWHSPDGEIRRTLATFYGPERWASPAYGIPGHYAVIEAARAFGAEPVLPPDPTGPAPEGVVF